MISYGAKKSLLYQELDSEKRKEFFDFTQKAFHHNIDTLYYVIKLDCDWNHSGNAEAFRNYLIKQQEHIYNVEQVEMFKSEDRFKNVTGEWLSFGISSKWYKYDLQQADKFAMFVVHRSPNPHTPEIIVQLRSQFLWLEGEHKAILKSLKDIESVLDSFDLKIKDVRENRIDYAYHTNYVQNPTTYFKHQNIAKMQQSRFTRGSIEFSFRNQFITETDYLTLGRKKSNNLFFRIYDKTKEVIQQQYKQFFIEMWYQKKMINGFDRYCIEKAFMNPSADNYKYLDVARLEFYLQHGSSENMKNEIRSLLEKKSKDYEKIIALADMLTPDVTKILNVEIETKRKFYATLDNVIDVLLSVKTDCEKHSERLFRIIDNKKLFHDFLTRNTSDGSGVIRFLDYKAKNQYGKPWKHKRDFPTSDFWQRLQSVQLDNDVPNVQLVREYQQNLNVALVKKRLVNSMTVFSLYQNGENKNDPFMDAIDFLSTLNETDLEKANQYKTNKFLQLQERLVNSEASLAKVNDFGILDLHTGEVLGATTDQRSAELSCVDYNTISQFDKDEAIDFTSIENVAESVILDYEKEIRQLKKKLKSRLTQNEKAVIEKQILRLLRKIDEIKAMM